MRRDNRATRVTALANDRVDRDLTEERHTVLLRRAPPATFAEDRGDGAAARADEPTHVLDDADDRRLHLLEHLQTLDRIGQGDILRRGDDDCTGEGNLLRQRQLHVAGTRRQVDYQVVEILPEDIVQKLGDQLRNQRAAPDESFVGVE